MTQLIGGKAVIKPGPPNPQSHSIFITPVVKEIQFLVIMNINEKI